MSIITYVRRNTPGKRRLYVQLTHSTKLKKTLVLSAIFWQITNIVKRHEILRNIT